MPVDQKRTQGASSEVIRDINRRLILNLIRTRQPISRADLARVSGLQRSTVSLIVEELIGESWVVEGPTGRLPRGRRPTFLQLNGERAIVAVDIRPSQITVALADANGKFLCREAFPTPADPATAMPALIRAIQRVVATNERKTIEGVGISLPGRYNHSIDRLVFAPNLQWRDVDIRNPIIEATGLAVEVENAANACVLAAVWFDHMQENNLVVVTVSEGVGTGVWANRQLVRGLNGMAGEFGHVPLDPTGPACGCGGRGCWEVFASNRAALRDYGGEPGLTFSELLTRADRDDARAAAAVETMARHVGRGMRMLVAGLSPGAIVLVGELTRAWTRIGPIIEAEVQAQVLPGGCAPRLVPAYEDGMARLRGTVALILQRDFGTLSETQA